MNNKLLSFSEFEGIYESYGFVMESAEAVAAAPAPTKAENSVLTKEGEPKEDVADLLDIFKKLAEESEVKEAEDPKVNTLKPVKMGETSDRVKEIQKLLGLKEDGQFGTGTQKAVMAFQKENKLKVDGVVGVQTYGKMLEIKKGITDQAELEKMKEEFKKMSVKLSNEITSIINDPRYYEIYERIEIVNIKGVTYVICTPKKDAKTKLEALKAEGLLSSGFEWLLLAGEALGKAVVYTTLGVAVVALEVAKAMVNGVISATKFLANGAMSLMSNVVYGLGQIGKWVYTKGAEAYKAISQKAEDIWKGFVGVASTFLKSSAEALVAFTGAIGNYLKSVGAAAGTVIVALGNLALTILKPVAKTLGLAWEGIKTLGDAAKSGLTWIAKKGKAAVTAIGNGIKSAYASVVAKTKQIGSDVLAGLKSAGKAVTQAVGNGITSAGNAISSFGGWIGGLFNEAYHQTGNAIFESVRKELRLDLISEDIDTDFIF
jgi:peptidoglycan hydrolase-like protein with peptidoglycan-binding domain